MKGTINQLVSGRVKAAVVDQQGRIIKETPWLDNLILDGGLDALGAHTWAQVCESASLGTGTTKLTGSDATVILTQTGSIVTASGPFFSTNINDSGYAAQGVLLRYSSSKKEFYVDSFMDSTHILVTSSYTITPGDDFKLFRVNQKKLAAFSPGRVTASNGFPELNYTVWNNNTMSHFRAFDFSIEASPVTYQECGFCWNNNPTNPDIFSRILLPGFLVPAGMGARLYYQLNVVVSPSAVQSITDDLIGGWPFATGSQQIFAASGGMSYVAPNGASGLYANFNGALEPTGACYIFLSSTSSLPQFQFTPKNYPAQNNNPSQSARPASMAPYINGSFYTIKSASFSPTAPGSSGSLWRMIGVTGISSSTPSRNPHDYAVFGLLFDNSQSKDSSHYLDLYFKTVWGRNLDIYF